MTPLSTPNLSVTEIYASVQGESTFAGSPCTFVRLSGCPLRCRWCDTSYSFHGGESLTILDVVAKVRELALPLVELTGGEPLAQEGAVPLLEELIAAGFKVLLETSGALPIAPVPPACHVIMDLKAPGSGMTDKNLWQNIDALAPHHEVKIVLANRGDFDWALDIIERYNLAARCQVLLSPAFGLLPPKTLVEWLLASKVPARLNLQIHKYIWSPRQKGV